MPFIQLMVGICKDKPEELHHVVPEKLHKRAKITDVGSFGGGASDESLAAPAQFHKRAKITKVGSSGLSSMKEAKKEVERAELNCFQIKTVELDDKVFNGNGAVAAVVAEDSEASSSLTTDVKDVVPPSTYESARARCNCEWCCLVPYP